MCVKADLAKNGIDIDKIETVLLGDMEHSDGSVQFMQEFSVVEIKARAFDYLLTHLPAAKDYNLIQRMIYRSQSTMQNSIDDTEVILLKNLLMISIYGHR